MWEGDKFMGNPFKSYAKDIVKLKKQSGDEFSNIQAHVQKDQIFIHDSMLPIEEGDRLIRVLFNGLEESYCIR